MFVAINRLKAKQGHGHELEARFAQRRGVERQPGFLGFELLKRVWSPHGDDGAEEYLVVTRWRSREDHRAWTQSAAFAQAHAGPRPDFLLGPGEPAGYAVRLSHPPVPPVPDEKTVVLLVGHGFIPEDFPRDVLQRYFHLHMAVGFRELGEGERAELSELEARLRNWPRTPENDPHHASMLALAEGLEARCGLPVRVVFNEFCAPSLEEGVRRAADDGYRRVLVLSTMFNRGGHAEEDIPEAIERARAAHPNVEVQYLWPYRTEDVVDLLAAHLTSHLMPVPGGG
jgi:sirohydrochlorin cobaltochelatase